MRKQIETAAFNYMERLLGRFATDGQRNFHDVARFPWIRELEQNYETIRQEVEALCRERDAIPYIEDINPQQRSIVADARWRTYFLHAFRHALDGNLRRCPGTAALLQRVPNLVMAFFSILEPGTTLKPHRGIYKGVLRYHLGIQIPVTKEKCGLTVAGDYMPWANGKSFVFDDTFEHFAQNESDCRRAVLIVDFEREVPFWLRGLNRAAISAIGRSDFVRNSFAAAERPGAAVSGGKSLY
jgi:aspartyl/asparaginyl beta-hydroxylase (cupin superfamily)